VVKDNLRVNSMLISTGSWIDRCPESQSADQLILFK